MKRRLAVGVVAAMMLAGTASGSWAQEEAPLPAIEVTAGPKWGDVPAGSWVPYSLTVRNNGQSEINGEVVLTAKPEPPPKPGATPTTIPASTSPAPVVAIGGRSVTAPLPQSPEVASWRIRPGRGGPSLSATCKRLLAPAL